MTDKQDVIVSLLKEIDKNIENLGGSETDVLLSNRITTLENSVKTINTDINGIKTTNTTQTTNITSNTNKIDTANQNITNLTNELSTVKSNVSTNTSNIGTLTTDVNTLKTTSATKTELNTTKTSLNTTNTNVSNLTTRVANVENKATTNESNLNTLNERVTTLENAEPSSGGDGTIIIPITYSELKTLRDNSSLIAGQQYRITDYVATTIVEHTQSANHPFDIIVTAYNANTLYPEAKATQHEGDAYFADIDMYKWNLLYSLDNDTDKFEWADSENGKGVIYRMVDENNNESSYDFKGIQFKRWKITGFQIDDVPAEECVGKWAHTLQTDDGWLTLDENDFIWCYLFSHITDSGINDYSVKYFPIKTDGLYVNNAFRYPRNNSYLAIDQVQGEDTFMIYQKLILLNGVNILEANKRTCPQENKAIYSHYWTINDCAHNWKADRCDGFIAMTGNFQLESSNNFIIISGSVKGSASYIVVNGDFRNVTFKSGSRCQCAFLTKAIAGSVMDLEISSIDRSYNDYNPVRIAFPRSNSGTDSGSIQGAHAVINKDRTVTYWLDQELVALLANNTPTTE